MRRIRTEMRAAASSAMTVPQLRTLVFVDLNPDVNLSTLADHLGVGVTGASGLVDRLVRQRLLSRETDPNERRRIRLTVTGEGQQRLDEAVAATRLVVAGHLASLSQDEAATVASAMEILREHFSHSAAARQ